VYPPALVTAGSLLELVVSTSGVVVGDVVTGGVVVVGGVDVGKFDDVTIVVVS